MTEETVRQRRRIGFFTTEPDERKECGRGEAEYITQSHEGTKDEQKFAREWTRISTNGGYDWLGMPRGAVNRPAGLAGMRKRKWICVVHTLADPVRYADGAAFPEFA